MKVRTFALATLVTLVSVIPLAPAHSTETFTISDRTGDPQWQAATRYAVDAWNSSGANVHIVWAEGGVGCQTEGHTVPVCKASIRSGWAGVTTYYSPEIGSYIRVSSRKGFSQVDKNAIATHEVGHSLGVDHSTSTTSIMYPRQQSNDRMSPADHDALRNEYR